MDLHLSISDGFVSSKFMINAMTLILILLIFFFWMAMFHDTNSKRLWVGLILLISFQKIIIRHKRIGYDLNVMRQSACLVINQIKVNNFAALFNCTPVDRASDSMMAPT